MKPACPRCIVLVHGRDIRRETLQPLRGGAADALAVDGSGPCCRDCEAADNLMKLASGLTFVMARVATGNFRQESMRLPGVKMGIAKTNIVQVSEEGELDSHHDWLNAVLPDPEQELYLV